MHLRRKTVQFLAVAGGLIIVRVVLLLLVDCVPTAKFVWFVGVAVTMLPELAVLAVLCTLFGIGASNVVFNYLYGSVIVVGSLFWAWFFVFRTRVVEILCSSEVSRSD